MNPHETVLELESPAEFGDIELFVRTANQTERTDFADPERNGQKVIAVVTYGIVEDELLRISR